MRRWAVVVLVAADSVAGLLQGQSVPSTGRGFYFPGSATPTPVSARPAEPAAFELTPTPAPEPPIQIHRAGGAEHYPRAQAVDSIIIREMRRQDIPGVSLAILENSRVVYVCGYGLADVEKNVPVMPETLFNLASVSKPITAIAAMRLVEQGKLNLNAPVQEYVPDFPQKKWPITSMQLLGHLSGIRHYKGAEVLSTKHYTDVILPLEIFKNDALVHEPGSAYLYSSYGFNLLGAVIQGAAGEPFLDYVRKNVFAPAGMQKIYVCDGTGLGGLAATGYTSGGSNAKRAPVFDASNKIPSGGFIANAPDMGRFMIALFNGKLLSKQSMDVMWKSQHLANGTETRYGLGWFVGNWRGNLRASHSGGQPGFTTNLYCLPKRGFAVVMLTNKSGAKISGLAEEFRDLVF